MSERVRCNNLQEFQAQFKRHMERQIRRTKDALKRTAVDGAGYIKTTAPKAFGELRESAGVYDLPGDNAQIRVSAPHAAAVEQGSMPHTPDMQALIAWVKLRGMQGIRQRRVSISKHGPTTFRQSRRVAQMLREEVVRAKRGSSNSDGQHSPIDAPERVAQKIAAGIKEHGTQPHFFVRKSLPMIEQRLHRHMQRAWKQ